MTIKDLAREIELIKSNHLAHMAEDIDKMDKKIEKMDTRVWAILILLVTAVILPAVVAFIQANT
jgi:hypothetical protein